MKGIRPLRSNMLVPEPGSPSLPVADTCLAPLTPSLSLFLPNFSQRPQKSKILAYPASLPTRFVTSSVHQDQRGRLQGISRQSFPKTERHELKNNFLFVTILISSCIGSVNG